MNSLSIHQRFMLAALLPTVGVAILAMAILTSPGAPVGALILAAIPTAIGLWIGLSSGSEIETAINMALNIINQTANKMSVMNHQAPQVMGNLIMALSNLNESIIKDQNEAAESQADSQANQQDGKQHYAAALEVCQAMVMLADNDMNIVYANKQATQMLAKREAEINAVLPAFNMQSLIGTNADVFHVNPAHQRGKISSLSNAAGTEIKVGDLTFGLMTSPWMDETGTRVGTVIEWEDRTEALKAQLIADNEAAENGRIAAALKVCQANVMMADADLNIVYMNDSVVSMLSDREKDLQSVLSNFNTKTLMGTCVDDFHANPAHQRGMLDGLKDTYETDLELAGLTFGLIATPVFDDAGKRSGTVVEWNDKTEALAAKTIADQQAAENGRIAAALKVCQANVMMADADLNIV
ncbi:MAG: PAS domain-containing protein, partial [Pseudomonadales bacterium]|nr:PAS domain-containing protein [Pseudomonadales bacterium]